VLRSTALLRKLAGYAGQLAAVGLVVGVGSAVLTRIVPGDPAISILGTRATPESLQALRHELGTDQSLLVQVRDSLWRLMHFDLGYSIAQPGQHVSTLIAPTLSVTLSIVALTLVLATALGLPLGLAAALSKLRGLDQAIRQLCVVFLACPPFFAGLLLLLLVALKARLAPAGGWAGSWPQNLSYLWLPSLALSVYLIPLIARTVRYAAQEASGELFVEAAISRGLPGIVVVGRHVLPNSVLPVLTLLGYNAAALIGGAVVIEAVFALPGIGNQLVQAVQARDYPVVVGISIITGMLVVAINILTDLLNGAIDPRVRVRD
jgi:peptide/nickel transport system permease protein